MADFIGNINDPDVSQTPDSNTGSPNLGKVTDPGIQTEQEFNQEKYSGLGQQALTVAEGLGQGFAGPAATGAEKLLSSAGVPGLSPEEQHARAETNPGEHIGSQIAGFGLGALTGTGEAEALGALGKGATELAGSAGVVSKLAQTGIKTGAELAALQAGDEVSKAINQDPNFGIGAAAINIGLSGILGGAGGTVLGTVSPLFGTVANKLGVTKLATEFMGETKFLQDNPELVTGAAQEIQDRMAQTSEILDSIQSQKGVIPGPFPNYPPAPGTPLLRSSGFEAVQKLIPKLEEAESDLFPKITAREMGDRVVDPDKLQNLIAQAAQGRGALKVNAVNNYLKITQAIADAAGKSSLENGEELESVLNPTPVLDHTLNSPLTPGRALAQWASQKGAQTLANAAGEAGAGAVGGIAGSLVGHPLLGAWAAEKILSPTFSALAKPFAEKAIDSDAMRASVDYIANAVKGDEILSKSVKDFFRGVEVVPSYLIPNTASRDKLEKSLDYVQNPDNMFQVGGKISHYLPDHGVAAASVAAQATNYLAALKPTEGTLNGLDATPPIDKIQAAKYERALDIAQQPLLVLKHAKQGALLPEDVQTLHTLYPSLHSSMIQKISNELISHKSNGGNLPYPQRVSLSLLTGAAMDSTTTTQSAQSIIRSAGTQQAAVAANERAKKSGSTAAQIKTMEKSDDLYATKLQAREIDKRQ